MSSGIHKHKLKRIQHSRTPSKIDSIRFTAMKSLNYSDGIRLNHLLRVCAGAVVAYLLWTFLEVAPCPVDDPGCHDSSSTSQFDTLQRSPDTTVLSHAPGFTTIQGAFWRNHTWYFISSKKWAFPPMEHIVTNGPDHGEELRWDDSVARILDWQEAKELGLEVEDAVNIKGSSVSFSRIAHACLGLTVSFLADHLQRQDLYVR